MFSGDGGRDLLLECFQKMFSACGGKETRKKNVLDTNIYPKDREQQALEAVFFLLNGTEIKESNETALDTPFASIAMLN